MPQLRGGSTNLGGGAFTGNRSNRGSSEFKLSTGGKDKSRRNTNPLSFKNLIEDASLARESATRQPQRSGAGRYSFLT